jgi:hypothetical protein
MAMEINDETIVEQQNLFEVPELTEQQIAEMPIEELLRMVLEINCLSMANGRKVVSYSLKMSERIQKELVKRQVDLTKDMTGIAFNVLEAAFQAFGGTDNPRMQAASLLFGGAGKISVNTLEAHKIPLQAQMSTIQSQIMGNTNIEQIQNGNVDKAKNDLNKVDDSETQTKQALIR